MGLEQLKSEPPYADERTRAFLIGRIEQRAFRIPEEIRNSRKGDTQVRENNIVGSYYTSDATLEEVGEKYPSLELPFGPLSRERVRQIIKTGMRRIWESAPAQLQAEFPWGKDTLPLRKPLSLHLRRKLSLSHGGTSVGIEQTIQARKSAEELLRGYSEGQISSARRIIKNWGTDITSTYRILSGEAKKHLEGQVSAAKTKEEVKLLFSQVTMGYYRTETKGENPSLIKLEDLLVSCGFRANIHTNKKAFICVLEGANITVGCVESTLKGDQKTRYILRYYFLRSRDVEAAKAVLSSNLSLRRFLAQR